MDSDPTQLRRELAAVLSFVRPTRDPPVVKVVSSTAEDGFVRHRIEYEVPGGDVVPALLFEPLRSRPCPGVLVFHQHASKWHFGKSEVAGLVGERWQAFGPVLARAGIVVLAPDSIAFEDRRHGVTGTEAHDDDWLQHYNEMAYRLLDGVTLMGKVLSDAADALSVLRALPSVADDRVGVLGHSYGGNTALFHAAVDDRVQFAASSGAACSFSTKIASRTGIEMAEVIPGFRTRFDVDDLIRAIAPRSLLVVSADGDPYSADSPAMAELAAPAYATAPAALTSYHYTGGHSLDEERFTKIVNWTIETAVCAT